MGDPLDIDAAVATLRALANAARLRIVFRLLDGECAVSALEAGLGVRQPNLSQHLAELRDAGLVASRKEHRAVFYRIADDDRRRLIQAVLHGFVGGVPTPAPRAPAGRVRHAATFATLGGD